MPSHLERQVGVHVDLKGSNCGPGWNAVDLVLAPGDWTDERIRQGAADHYAVPLEQVGPVREHDAGDRADDEFEAACLAWDVYDHG